MTIFLLLPTLLLLAYLSWRWPDKAVSLIVFLIPTYLIRTSAWNIPTNLFELLVVAFGLIVILTPAWRKEMVASDKPKGLFLILFSLFIAASIVSTIISPVPRVSLGILKGWIIIPIVFAFFAATFGQKKKIIDALIWSGVTMAIFALTQIGQFSRLKGIYDVPNSLALWLAPILVMALWLGIRGKKLYLILAMPMAIALIGAQSVMGIISVVVALAVGAVIASLGAYPVMAAAILRGGNPGGISRFVRKDVFIAIVVFVLVSASFLLWSGKINYLLRPLFDRNYTNSISVRMQLWSISIDLIKEHPILGIGLGQFEPAYQKKLHERFIAYENAARPFGGRKSKPPIPEFVFRDPHNWILSFWLNAGLLGLVSFAGINFLTIKKIFSPQSSEVKSALLVIIIFGLADTIYWKNDLSLLYWLLVMAECPNGGLPLAKIEG